VARRLRSYGGKHLQLEDARVFDLPAELPVIAVAASWPVSARIAAELGDGLFATEPDGGLVSCWQDLGGSGHADQVKAQFACGPDVRRHLEVCPAVRRCRL
jgi:alkanesulfonate monooxygenase SsuD/methylene tetrahydromethanopterin reductase-like flavin-dependent oxidoreductase (luciferase family)